MKESELDIPSLDELFDPVHEENSRPQRIVNIMIEEISDFPNHPFQVRDDQEMYELAETIQKSGVLVPAIVRKKEKGRLRNDCWS